MPSGTISLASLNGRTSVDVNISGYGDTGRANTFFFWGVFDGASVTIQAAPGQLNVSTDINSKEWFDVRRADGTPATFTAKGTMNVVGRAVYYRLFLANMTALTAIMWEVR